MKVGQVIGRLSTKQMNEIAELPVLWGGATESKAVVTRNYR